MATVSFGGACVRLGFVFLLFAWSVNALAAVGATTGGGGVTPAGASAYDIPFVLPPGIAGLQPQLGLSYSSRRDNGLIGMGWAISGVSALERCPKNISQDNLTDSIEYTNGDRYCLDGNRLRLTSGIYGAPGSVYQTEIEVFSRITAYGGNATNGPDWFRVEGKDGLIYEYGNSTDSRIEAKGTSIKRAWALSGVFDRSGNYIRLYYTEDATNGSYRPDRIEYTGTSTATPIYKIKFVYQARPATDPVTRYQGGLLIKEVNRLLRIEVRYLADDSVIHEYRLTYSTAGGMATQRSRLASVTECGLGGTDCFPATSVAWQGGGKDWTTTIYTASTNLSTIQMQWAHAIDINGDGRDDLVYPVTTAGGKWHVMLANESNGFQSPYATAVASDTNYSNALSIDVDGNGKRDLIIPNSGNWWWFRHTGTSYSSNTYQFSQLTFTYGGAIPAAPLNGDTFVADINGDGLEDLVWAERMTGQAS